jgi:hypothetical protein
MDPILVSIIGKYVLMAMLAVGGIFQIWAGLRLYKDGVGANPVKATISFGKFKANTTSTGTFVMATAALWAVCVVLMNPAIKKDGPDRWQVSSFSVPGAFVQAPTIVASQDPAGSVDTPDEVKEAFQRAAKSHKEIGNAGHAVTINGKPAELDFSKLATFRSESGNYVVTIPVRSGASTAYLAYLPKKADGRLTFELVGIGPSNPVGASTRPQTSKPRDDTSNPSKPSDDTSNSSKPTDDPLRFLKPGDDPLKSLVLHPEREASPELGGKDTK